MRIETIGETLKDTTRFASLVVQKSADMKLKSFEVDGKTETKTAPDGRPVYRTQLQALRIVDGQPVGQERDVTLAVIEPCDITPGVTYGLSGLTWITHYSTSNGRVGVSIITERVRPIEQLKPVDVKAIARQLSGGNDQK